MDGYGVPPITIQVMNLIENIIDFLLIKGRIELFNL